MMSVWKTMVDVSRFALTMFLVMNVVVVHSTLWTVTIQHVFLMHCALKKDVPVSQGSSTMAASMSLVVAWRVMSIV